MNITLDTISKVYHAGRASVDTMQLKGYELITEFFVDSSGFGLESEPALTKNQFERELYQAIRDNNNGGKTKLTVKITNVGQFQVYVGLFKKSGKSKVKKIANNTLQIDDGAGDYRIRLHDTDIITCKNGQITLNTDGWKTKTTKDRINQYLPSGYWINQKDYKWYFNTPEGVIEYHDGITI